MEATFPDRRFLRLAAISSLAAAGCILIAQIALAAPAPQSLEEAIRRYADPGFRARAWIVLIQVVLMFVGLLAVAGVLRRRTPTLAALALLALVFWQVLELLPRTVELFSASGAWAPAYLSEPDPEVRERLAERFRTFWSVAGSLRGLRQVCWGLAHALLGAAAWRYGGPARALGALFLLNALRLALGLAGGIMGHPRLGGGLAGFVVLTTPLFVLAGAWLWREGSPTGPAALRPPAAGG